MTMRASLAVLAVLAVVSGTAMAGPPYMSDDPEPTDYQHYEIYLFTNGMNAHAGTSGASGFDFNYGATPNLQLTAVAPIAYEGPAAGSTVAGFGNVELAAKYRFLHQSEIGWDVAVFPRVFLPSASARVGERHASLLLPLWLEKDWGRWSTFGGGGCVALLARARQGYRTGDYPAHDPSFPPLFRGRPVLDPEKCMSGCSRCVDICPTDALTVSASVPDLDLGRCIFCGECAAACPADAIAFTQDWRLAATERTGLIVTGDREVQVDVLRRELRRLLGRSLRLRQISAGGCNGCEVELNALGNVVFDSSRFGIEFVASPRHADGILVTGPITRNMKKAALKTYEAVADPKLVIAAGACAISGGIFRGHAEVCDGSDGVEDLFAVDLYVPGCPPHPYTILDALLRLLGRREPEQLVESGRPRLRSKMRQPVILTLQT